MVCGDVLFDARDSVGSICFGGIPWGSSNFHNEASFSMIMVVVLFVDVR